MPVQPKPVPVGVACHHEYQRSLRLETHLVLAGNMTRASDLVEDVRLGPWDVRALLERSRVGCRRRRFTPASTGQVVPSAQRDPATSRAVPDPEGNQIWGEAESPDE